MGADQPQPQPRDSAPSPEDQELSELWDQLTAGVAEGPHPFHTASLATVGTHSGASVAAEVRTVVLRYVDRKRWRVDLHTDLRSPKVAEIRANPAVSLLLYDAPGKRQLRVKGRATIHNQDDLTAERWETVRSQSRLCYRTPVAPGSPVPAVSDVPTGGPAGGPGGASGVPGAVSGGPGAVSGGHGGASGVPAAGPRAGSDGPSDALLTEAAGYDNFCVITVELTELEALDLNHLGHSRRRWTRSDGGHERWEVAP